MGGKKRVRPLTAKAKRKASGNVKKSLRRKLERRRLDRILEEIRNSELPKLSKFQEEAFRAAKRRRRPKKPDGRGVRPGTKRGPYKKRVSKRRLEEAGLPLPVSMQLPGTYTKRAFAKLQAEWYAKAAEGPNGVEDIEWHDEASGYGQNSSYLKRPDQMRIKHAKIGSFEFYRLCACYLQHNTSWLQRGDKLIWQMFTDGATYRQILRKLERLVNRRRSLFYVHGRIHAMRARMQGWHSEHPEGLLHPGADDVYVEDVLLREPDPVPKAD